MKILNKLKTLPEKEILNKLKTLPNEKQLIIGSLLVAGIDPEDADQNASWDTVQDKIEKYLSGDPATLRAVSLNFDTIAQRLRERAEDIRLENRT